MGNKDFFGPSPAAGTDSLLKMADFTRSVVWRVWVAVMLLAQASVASSDSSDSDIDVISASNMPTITSASNMPTSTPTNMPTIMSASNMPTATPTTAPTEQWLHMGLVGTHFQVNATLNDALPTDLQGSSLLPDLKESVGKMSSATVGPMPSFFVFACIVGIAV